MVWLIGQAQRIEIGQQLRNTRDERVRARINRGLAQLAKLVVHSGLARLSMCVALGNVVQSSAECLGPTTPHISIKIDFKNQ